MCMRVCSAFTCTESQQSAEKWQTERKKSNERNAKIRKGGKRGRERERIPCCFSNQEASSSSLGDLFSLFSFMSQFSNPPPPPPPPLFFFFFFFPPHSFSPSSFCGQLVNTCLLRNDDRNTWKSRKAVLVKWLTCKGWGSPPKSVQFFALDSAGKTCFSVRRDRKMPCHQTYFWKKNFFF